MKPAAQPRHARTPRLVGGRGASWQKRTTPPLVNTGWTINFPGEPAWVPPKHELASYHRSLTDTGDLAALVEAVRHCAETGVSIPTWIVDGLERWLAEFLVLATVPKYRPTLKHSPRVTRWARDYIGAARDFVIADHLERNRLVDGLTRAEALDEATCYFRGTPLAGSPAALEDAWKRARRRARQGWFQRLSTRWESRELYAQIDPGRKTGDSCYWWAEINNAFAGNNRGEWRRRPRLLAKLSLAALEKEVERARARVRAKPASKSTDT